MNSGYLFLCVASGIMAFVNLIMTSIAISDDKDYAGFLAVVEVILIIVFLASGFLGFQTR